MKMRYYNGRKFVRVIFYGMLVTVMIIFLVAILNFVFLMAGAYTYASMDCNYIYGGRVMEALRYNENGYMLDEKMHQQFEELDQWAMLLDEDGQVVWSVRKPEELGDAYTQSDIARMTRYYLKGYPVQLRVWDDKIMVVGMQKDTIWKYNIEFPISWMDFVKKIWLYYLLVNFAWIVVLAFVFTRRFMKNRERARIEWIAGVSHDIRTPLSVVMGYADTLEHDTSLTEEARQQAATIRHQSTVMKELIADLNLTSRLEYSMQALRKEKVRFAEVIRSTAAEFLNDTLSEELKIDVQIEEEAEHICVMADRQLFVRVFRNLINNSIKHSGQSKPINIQISMWKVKRKCYIRFEDNGVGYSEEILRGLLSRKKNGAGQNIHGLEIVKKIVLAHGGKIRFGNCAKGGSYCLMVLRGEKRLDHNSGIVKADLQQ